MNKQEEYLSNLAEIRSLMERSSRFLSLSGLSGIFAGIWALLGSLATYLFLDYHWLQSDVHYGISNLENPWSSNAVWFLLLTGTGVLILALITGFYFTRRKAKIKNLPLWDASARHLLINLFIPLITGGIFCLILISHGLVFLIAPATLLFYGLALINASRYTLQDIRHLGIAEIILGLAGAAFPGYGFLLWTIGFGILHIVYGTIMFRKYEKNL